MQLTLQKMIGSSDVRPSKAGRIIIGNACWLGDNCTVLRDVHVGDGAVIGAGAVVTKDVPPFSIVAGIPAKVVRYRFTENVIKQLLEIAWWNWPMERILSEKRFFTTEIPHEKDFDVFSLLNE